MPHRQLLQQLPKYWVLVGQTVNNVSYQDSAGVMAAGTK